MREQAGAGVSGAEEAEIITAVNRSAIDVVSIAPRPAPRPNSGYWLVEYPSYRPYQALTVHRYVPSNLIH